MARVGRLLRPAVSSFLLLLSTTLLLSLSFLPTAVQAQPPYLGTCNVEGTSSPHEPNTITNSCDCIDGWSGPECSVCRSSAACKAQQNYTGPFDVDELTCDASFGIVQKAHGVCRIATQAVSDFLKGKGYMTTTVTNDGEMHMEFVKVTGPENVYATMFKCDGKNCTQIYDPKTKKIQTACPGTKCNMTCEVGGPDASCTPFVASQITQIGQKGPVTLTCLEPGVKANGSECIMHEQLLDFFFKGVELTDCHFGECVPEGLHANVAEGSISEFALKNAQIFEETTYILAAVFGVLVFIVICLGLLLYYGLSEYYSLESCEVLVAGLPPLITQPYPCTLTFKKVGYNLKGRQILKGISGVAPAGEILAIMGPSGCGKSTLMDILSMKNKSGRVTGQIYVNGAPLKESFKQHIGFVDQHDMLLSTLTVMESLMFSGLLRLPQTLSMKEKTQRVLTVLNELQLDHIADSAIGNELVRGISGGEKRRVSVGMELVMQPRALFLDEPTSGLDSYNADLLVQILTDLAQARQTSIIMVIHQPRANIFNKLDRLLLVCKGEAVFCGAARDVHPYFASIGRPIPPAYNPADYLIDILFTHNLMVEEEEEAILALEEAEKAAMGEVTENPVNGGNMKGDGVAKIVPLGAGGGPEDEGVGVGGAPTEGEGEVVHMSLAELYAESAYAEQTEQEVEETMKPPPSQAGERESVAEGEEGGAGGAGAGAAGGGIAGARRGAGGATTPLSSRFLLKATSSLKPEPKTEEEEKEEQEARVSWLVEISVVSQRMFKDMLRKPFLTITHLVACVYYGCLLGVLYYQISLSGIAAVQNRMGIFMLEALFLAFTSVSALPLFWLERPLYIHERSNRYYGTLSYFVSKIFSDLIPLRVIPPVLLSITTQLLVGLRGGMHFFTYALVLVLMTTIAATINLVIGMLVKSIMSGILVATILMIHLILLTTIFVNFDTMKVSALRGLRYVSFFNYGYEALVVNELADRKIEDFDISDGSVVLRTLGFHTESLSFNTFVLFVYLIGTMGVAYAVLRFCVKEKR